MFRGLHSLNLDTKGRLAIPAKYRDALAELCAGRLVVTVTVDDPFGLSVYPIGEWEAIEAKLNALPSLNKDVRRIQRLLIGYATDLEMDSGRILLPPSLRERPNGQRGGADGAGQKLELWNKADWDAEDDAYRAGEVGQNLPGICWSWRYEFGAAGAHYGAAQTVDGCLNDPKGIYVDGTFGRGGHSRLLLSKLCQKGA